MYQPKLTILLIILSSLTLFSCVPTPGVVNSIDKDDKQSSFSEDKSDNIAEPTASVNYCTHSDYDILVIGGESYLNYVCGSNPQSNSIIHIMYQKKSSADCTAMEFGVQQSTCQQYYALVGYTPAPQTDPVATYPITTTPVITNPIVTTPPITQICTPAEFLTRISCNDQYTNSAVAVRDRFCNVQGTGIIDSPICTLLSCANGFYILNSACIAIPTNTPPPVVTEDPPPVVTEDPPLVVTETIECIPNQQVTSIQCSSQDYNSTYAYVEQFCNSEGDGIIQSENCIIETCATGYVLQNNMCLAGNKYWGPVEGVQNVNMSTLSLSLYTLKENVGATPESYTPSDICRDTTYGFGVNLYSYPDKILNYQIRCDPDYGDTVDNKYCYTIENVGEYQWSYSLFSCNLPAESAQPIILDNSTWSQQPLTDFFTGANSPQDSSRINAQYVFDNHLWAFQGQYAYAYSLTEERWVSPSELGVGTNDLSIIWQGDPNAPTLDEILQINGAFTLGGYIYYTTSSNHWYAFRHDSSLGTVGFVSYQELNPTLQSNNLTEIWPWMGNDPGLATSIKAIFSRTIGTTTYTNIFTGNIVHTLTVIAGIDYWSQADLSDPSNGFRWPTYTYAPKTYGYIRSSVFYDNKVFITDGDNIYTREVSPIAAGF